MEILIRGVVMRKLMRPALSVELKNALQDAINGGLSWDDFDKRQVRCRLREMQAGLCAYCERKLNSNDDRTRIDHFVPQSSPEGRGRIFDWNNYYLSCDCCETCDCHKSNDTREIVNPDTDDPSRFFTYASTGAVCIAKGLSIKDAQKAQNTIDVLNLHCPSLESSRVIAFNKMRKYLGANALKQMMQCRIVEFHTFCEYMLSSK